MPGPQQSLCPKCNQRPRRHPGARCLECYRLEQQAFRAGKRSPRAAVQIPDSESKRYARTLDAKRYLITSAQNATPAHPEFLATLKVAAKHLGAELVVVPYRYRNPSNAHRQTDLDHDEWWDPTLEPFLFNVRKKLGPNLVLCADVKIQPTASSPLSGFESLTGAESCIIGAPKMQLRAVPSPSGKSPKILSTTGACTRRSYSDTKAGKLGAFHHFLGAVIVELDGKRFHLRQINANRVTGEFTDLDRHYTAAGVRKAPPALGLAMGDTHARFTSPVVDSARFVPGGVVDVLRPRALIFHDLFDGYSTNPHHKGDPFIAAAKMATGFGDVRAEVEHAVKFVADRCKGRQAIIVSSNHDNFLARWVCDNDWRTISSKEFYLETATAMLLSTRIGPGGTERLDPFAYWVDKLKGKASIRCLAEDESYTLAGVECGMHGHRGPNGSRGSMKNLSRLGVRAITGHRHTPGIEEGHYGLGTSTGDLEYAHGPGSWLNTDCVIYASGARSLLTFVDGNWTTTKPLTRKRT